MFVKMIFLFNHCPSINFLIVNKVADFNGSSLKLNMLFEKLNKILLPGCKRQIRSGNSRDTCTNFWSELEYNEQKSADLKVSSKNKKMSERLD